jgi:hypothetical protein
MLMRNTLLVSRAPSSDEPPPRYPAFRHVD